MNLSDVRTAYYKVVFQADVANTIFIQIKYIREATGVMVVEKRKFGKPD